MLPAVLGFIVGVVLGSFSQATAGRVIFGKSLRGRSYCLQCQHKLHWYDLFPVLSFLLLSGKCRYCRKRIPLEDFLTEVIVGVLAAILFFTTFSSTQIEIANFSLNLQFLPAVLDLTFKLFTLSVLAIIFIIDLKTGLIPDRITYPAIIISLGYLLASGALKSYIFYQDFLLSPLSKYLMPPESTYLYDNLLRVWTPLLWTSGATVTITVGFILLIILTRGKGMGWGDVKYVLFLGFALGFPNIIPAIFIAFFSGAVVSILLVILKRKSFKGTVPFGPFLSLGAVVSLIYGAQIIGLYLQSF